MITAAPRTKTEMGTAVTVPISSYGRDGVIAGSVSVLVFTLVHQLTISNIWAMVGIMLVAGGLCGLCLAWSYGRLFDRYSLRTWLGYNAAHAAVFAALAVASVMVFEPATTMAAITARGGPVDDLIFQALPLTVVFTVVAAGSFGIVLARKWSDYLRLLLTAAVLMLFLGMNVSVLGLVDFDGASMAPAAIFFGLIALVGGVYVACFVALQWAHREGAAPRFARAPISRSLPGQVFRHKAPEQDRQYAAGDTGQTADRPRF